MISFPSTRITDFFNAWRFKKNGDWKHLRLGQAFFNVMELHKVHDPDDREYCNRIYNERRPEVAKKLIMDRIDPNS